MQYEVKMRVAAVHDDETLKRMRLKTESGFRKLIARLWSDFCSKGSSTLALENASMLVKQVLKRKEEVWRYDASKVEAVFRDLAKREGQVELRFSKTHILECVMTLIP
mmetsp:Transcript_9705/g.16339  ORF Transcript_9705/g.16339 Transcript_9705/m.16339 type:complete len:108 (-) Transcript_9705:59-382(-)